MWRGMFAGVLAVSSVAGAQQAAAPQQPAGDDAGAYTLKVTTQNVVLDVVVNDRKGNPVTGLKAGDFTVYEDTVPQVLKSFTEVTPESVKAGTIAVNSTAELDRLEPEAPVSIVVIDELALNTMDLAFAEYSLNRYLKGRGDMLDQPTMLIAANSQKIAILHDYTTSRKEILEALKHHDTDYNVLDRGQYASWQGEQASAAVGTLIAVAEATMGHHGHKNMIWVGRGFPPIDLVMVPADQVTIFEAAIKTCLQLLRDSRVTLYTIDPAGIRTDMQGGNGGGKYQQDPLGGRAEFDAIAVASGGQAMHGRNDVDHTIDETVRDGESFYTLSYRPAVKSDTAKDYRRIKVVMKDPNLVATTRQGYFATPAPVGAMKDADGKYAKQTMYDLTLAADSLLVYDGIPVTVIRDAAAPDKFVLRLRAADVPWQVDAPERESSALTVLMASYDKKGKLLEHSARTMTVHLPVVADGNGPDARAVNLPLTIATAAPVARVRFVVRSNGSGKIGAENFFLVDEKTLTDPAAGLDGKTARK